MDITPLSARYEDLDSADVLDALALHPLLVKTLADALPSVDEFFGHDAQIGLAVEREGDGSVTLYATILSPLDDAVLLDRLDKFGEAWWLDRMNIDEGRLVFNAARP